MFTFIAILLIWIIILVISVDYVTKDGLSDSKWWQSIRKAWMDDDKV